MATINAVGNGLVGITGSTAFCGTTLFSSWTPVFTFATPGNISYAGSTINGYYETAGNIYVVTFAITTTPTFTTASGNAQITGLPVASNSGTGNVAVGNFSISSTTWPTLATSLSLQIAAGASLITLVGSGTAQASANFTTSNFVSGVAITITGSIMYLV
jgi:hypothetical protein